MLSKNAVKRIKQLQLKKYRKKTQRFLVEGAKNISELLHSNVKIEKLYVTSSFFNTLNDSFTKKIGDKLEIVKDSELPGISTYQTNNAGVAIAEIPDQNLAKDYSGWTLLLDDIRDPGNLGTIIRIADWYGFRNVICSLESADFYNPKVISATMGSFTRVTVNYQDLVEVISNSPEKVVYGAFLGGDNIHELKQIPDQGFLVIGNESHGISQGIEKLCTNKITIPGAEGAESLNAAIATGIICDNIFRLKSK
ncbi:RNA methyltransferase [Marinigracilibium pacificum]|uniref:RNA methyltransferase n=1 Tax=Marinigracilibium pacificum TaxID=2729599 RepID=A0A848J1M0_9BACT|nr:RNA methyltransferase [Marinigracilibium pacificum]NMM50457.1 RNA methyltransferase [Marinigracilibium pacificum]